MSIFSAISMASSTAEVADGAFDLGMSKQELDCPQIAGTAVD
jgi:hypothetical protein